MKYASNTYLSQVKYWHVASLGIILPKAGDNKGAEMCTFFFRMSKVRFSYDMAHADG